MIIKTTIEIGIDLDDPIGQCDDDHIKHILTEKYQGTCLREHYIQSVDRIIRRGELIVNQLSPGAFATLPVIVEVTAVVFLQGELIAGCLIKNINERANFITCESTHANIILRKTQMFNSLKVGQYVTVQVATSQYAIGANRIAVSGVPYIPAVTAPVYKINPGAIPPRLLRDVQDRIKFEEDAAAELKKKDVKLYTIFSALVCAYVIPPKIAGVIPLTNIEALTARKYLHRDPKIPPTEPIVVAVDEPPAGDIHDVSAAEGVIAVLEDYCAQLRIVREMINIYSTPELIKSHANLWNIYKMNKADGGA